MSRPPTPRVGWHGNERGGCDRRLSRARDIPRRLGRYAVITPSPRAPVPRLSAAAATSVAGAAAAFALARSVNAALKTRQPSSLLPEGTGGAGSAGEAVSGSYAAHRVHAPPVDADAHRRNAEAWRRKWENAYALDDRGAGRATLANPPGFHHANVHPLLRKHKMALLGAGVTSPPEPSRRVFVPLCGASPDLLWLAACGHRVVGVELSGAVRRREGPAPRHLRGGRRAARHTGGIERVHISGNVAIVEGDLFSLDAEDGRRRAEANRGDLPEPDLFGDAPSERRLVRDAVATLRRVTGGAVTSRPDPEASYAADARVGARHSISFTEECLRFAAEGGPAMDAVWDRGALVAVAPDMRRRYARVIAARMAPGGRMLLVATSYDRGHQQPRGGNGAAGTAVFRPGARGAFAVRAPGPDRARAGERGVPRDGAAEDAGAAREHARDRLPRGEAEATEKEAVTRGVETGTI